MNEETFICSHCGLAVPPPRAGTAHRNHCPYCLWSRHVDIKPGDRRCYCRGGMEPVAIWARGDGEWVLLHRCEVCGTIKPNRIAGDDDEPALLALAARAIARPPFPVEGWELNHRPEPERLPRSGR